MRVLLIWEMVPEDLLGYVVTNPSQEVLEVLGRANGSRINTDCNEVVEKALWRLHDAICADDDCHSNPDDPIRGCFNKVSFPVEKVDKVFVCGVVL